MLIATFGSEQGRARRFDLGGGARGIDRVGGAKVDLGGGLSRQFLGQGEIGFTYGNECFVGQDAQQSLRSGQDCPIGDDIQGRFLGLKLPLGGVGAIPRRKVQNGLAKAYAPLIGGGGTVAVVLVAWDIIGALDAGDGIDLQSQGLPLGADFRLGDSLLESGDIDGIGGGSKRDDLAEGQRLLLVRGCRRCGRCCRSCWCCLAVAAGVRRCREQRR